jgi:phospholipase C
VPVYDHLAEEFAVCDRWFSSVAGATLPNRLYALCGGAAGSRDDRPSYLPSLYHQPSFVRHLDAHDIWARARNTLACAWPRPAIWGNY